MLLALLAPQGTPPLLRTEPSLDLVLRSATAHLVVVSAISACALAVAVADVWDALTSDRAYLAARPCPAAPGGGPRQPLRPGLPRPAPPGRARGDPARIAGAARPS